ncbi:MAG: spore germination protein GerW family protein [Dehalococcoidales bacterium]|nr:spore germination protein GerW family protein [Dehalococcoidales bacterium]
MAANEESQARGQEATKSTEGAAESARSISDTLGKLTAVARVEAAFGEPQRMGEYLMIPAAEVMCGMGFGTGGGEGDGPQGTGKGFGGGGGGGARSRPIATIVMGPEGVSIKPVLDMSKIYLAALFTAGFALVWAFRLARAGRDVGKVGREADKSLGRLGKLVRT